MKLKSFLLGVVLFSSFPVFANTNPSVSNDSGYVHVVYDINKDGMATNVRVTGANVTYKNIDLAKKHVRSMRFEEGKLQKDAQLKVRVGS